MDDDRGTDRVSRLTRLRHTPLRDLLRGRVSGQLDWRGIVAAFDIAPEAKRLVTRVVTSTHLWRIEKADVARDLLAHFADGLEEGLSSAQLIAEFGDPRQAARLIRRSKIRHQSLAWQMFRWTCVASALVLIFYCGMAVIFYCGRPSPKVDFVAQINRQIEQAPADQRAWPIYRSVLVVLRGKNWNPILSDSAYGRHWPEIAGWIDAHQPAIESIREATNLPVLGFLLGRSGSTAEPALFPANQTGANQNMTNLSMPQLQDLRVLADLLALDAKRARELGAGNRVERDITALADLAAQQKREGQLYVGQLLSVEILARSYDELDRTLVETPQVLDDAELVRVAHRISAPTTASDIISFASERLLFEDLIQRTFTDDGHGDGRISGAGLNILRANSSLSVTGPAGLLVEYSAVAAIQPASLLLLGSRKELLEEHRRLMDLNDAMIHVPLREADLSAPYDRWRALSDSPLSRMRYALLATLTPTLQRSAQIAEQTLGERDGLLVGLALELYHRRHQRYPDTLAQLTPGLLPAVPADRITGEPLKYRLVDAKPLVYSVGVDRIDDWGRLPVHDGHPAPNAAAQWGPLAKMVSGDWVLYPKPRIPMGQEQEN